jgi:hypothetical protein
MAGRGGLGRRVAGVLFGILVVAAGAAACSEDEAAAAEEFTREPVDTAGDNPFMDPVGTDEPEVEPPPDTGQTFEGNTPGLYGGTRDVGACDAEQMVTFLEANADKAAAWAGVLGIEVSEIRSFVATLTPVILRSDTYVTNHGFENGRATTIPAVLQAGTAVLVDDKGVPVVKCYCGNPLTAPPRTTGVRYRGPDWPAFQPTNITIVVETTVVIDIFTLVDPATGDPFGRPAGSDGSEDGPAPDDEDDEETDEEPPASTSTTTTTEPPDADIPTNATYNVSLTGDGAGGFCTPFSATTTATLADGQVTIQGNVPLTGPVNPDGTFTIDNSMNGATTHIEGRLDAASLSATATESIEGTTCTFTIEGTAG